MGESIGEISKRLRKASTGFAHTVENVRQAMKEIEKTTAQARKGLIIWREASEKDAGRLARMGWTVPFWATPRQTVELYKLKTEEEIEAYFISVYQEDEWGYGVLKDGLLSDKSLHRWQPLIQQSFRAYERGDYQIVVPALLTVFEGLVSELSGKLENKPNVRNVTQHKFNTSSGWPSRAVAESIDVFASEIFKNHSFKQERPEQINRHWILHGRDYTDWSQADALKLFHAIQTVSMLW